MRKFIYKNENGQVCIEAADMDLTQLAAEIGTIVNELYYTLYQQEPEAADFFKTAVVMVFSHPDSPTWNVNEKRDGIALCAMGKKSK